MTKYNHKLNVNKTILIHYSIDGDLWEITKAHSYDTGYDIRSSNTSDIIIKPRDTAIIPTGIRINIPYGIDVQIRSRSGLAANHKIAVLNSPGTIDPGYTGEIKVILINHSDSPYTVKFGDKVAQLILAYNLNSDLLICSNNVLREMIDITNRGDKGFGSSGR